MRRATSMRALAVAVLVAVAGATGACGSGGGAAREASEAGDIPDNQIFVAFTIPSGEFSVKVPEGWGRSEESGAVTFSDHFNSIRLEVRPVPASPSIASAEASDLPAIQAVATGFHSGRVGEVTRRAGTAILITYRATSAPDPVTGKAASLDVQRYAFWRDGKEAVITLSSPKGADSIDPWTTVTDSFAWK
jgi:hypothetical protein